MSSRLTTPDYSESVQGKFAQSLHNALERIVVHEPDRAPHLRSLGSAIGAPKVTGVCEFQSYYAWIFGVWETKRPAALDRVNEISGMRKRCSAQPKVHLTSLSCT